jgi:NADPH-dependent 2,4-dienoyl-CoA reductase/sulfur reductase-like enzyme
MTGMRRILVVGASAAGLAAAETLRSEGFGGELVMIGEEDGRPYDRPPLSKQIMAGAWEPARATLRDADALALLKAEWLCGQRATGLDLRTRRVTLSSGKVLTFDGLVIATGVHPRRLPGPMPRGVHVMRTMEDALAVKAALAERPRVVVVGGGVLGSELAASARVMGLDVTLVSNAATPMRRQFGPEIGERIAALHQERGVTLQLDVLVDRLDEADGRVTGVHLANGQLCPADLVLLAIGSMPATDWLQGSGLSLVDGVQCDEFCEAAPGVVAAGDVASWWHPGYGRRLRIEHRMNATEQGATAARTLLGNRHPFRPIPFFWTDQFDVKLQGYGLFPEHGRLEIHEAAAGQGRFVAICHEAGRAVGALGWNAPKELRQARQQLVQSMAEPLPA